MSFEEVELKRDDALLRISLLEMDNAVVAFFYEGKISLGTLAVALQRLGELELKPHLFSWEVVSYSLVDRWQKSLGDLWKNESSLSAH